MTAHGEALRSKSRDDPLLEGTKRDYTKLNLPTAEKAMLDYAVKLTLAPSSAGAEDVETLRSYGSTTALLSASFT